MVVTITRKLSVHVLLWSVKPSFTSKNTKVNPVFKLNPVPFAILLYITLEDIHQQYLHMCYMILHCRVHGDDDRRMRRPPIVMSIHCFRRLSRRYYRTTVCFHDSKLSFHILYYKYYLIYLHFLYAIK
jgi:hypothetical protein